jgi:cell division protein FtsQ
VTRVLSLVHIVLPRPRARGRRRAPMRALVTLLLAALVLGAAFLWVRDSSLVAVRDVRVSGLSSSERADVERALRDAASGMTTMHVDRGRLLAAVQGFSSVATVHVRTDFPHGMMIEVTERRPVAVVELGGTSVPVSAGGRLMRGVEAEGNLAVLHATRVAPGGRLTDRRALDAVTALAAAPPRLRARVARVSTSSKGLTLDLRSGPQLYFGTTERLDAKWLAAARVLAEPAAAGAVYLDIRVPERVAAGGLGTVEDEGTDALTPNSQAQGVNP